MVVLSALKPAPDEELEIAHNLDLGQADAVFLRDLLHQLRLAAPASTTGRVEPHWDMLRWWWRRAGGQEKECTPLLSMIASIVRSLQLAGMLAHGGVDGAGDSALERLARVMICPASMPLSCWRRCLSLSRRPRSYGSVRVRPEAREVLDVDVPTRQLACPARLIYTNCSANPAPAMEKEAILVGDSSQLDAEGKRN